MRIVQNACAQNSTEVGAAFCFYHIPIILTKEYIMIAVEVTLYMVDCQNYGPFLGTLNNRCRTIFGTQKGTIVLTTTHMNLKVCELQRSRQLRV